MTLNPVPIGPCTLPGPFLLAPMSGITSMVDRALAREHGAHACMTELVSAKGLIMSSRRTLQYLARAPDENPFWVQLFGGEVESMARASVIVAEQGADLIDINMGCPVRKVLKSGAGVALMADPDRAAAMVREMRRATGDRIPITAKFRAGWDADRITAVAFGRCLEAAGAAALILHPRLRSRHHSGMADWGLLKELKEAVSIPVIGSGGIRVAEDGYRMLEETGCDGAMVGRAALGNPWIFTGLLQRRDVAPSPAQRLSVVLDHFRRFLDWIGDRGVTVRKFRTRAIYYSRGLTGSAEFRRKVVLIREAEELVSSFEEFFGSAELV